MTNPYSAFIAAPAEPIADDHLAEDRYDELFEGQRAVHPDAVPAPLRDPIDFDRSEWVQACQTLARQVDPAAVATAERRHAATVARVHNDCRHRFRPQSGSGFSPGSSAPARAPGFLARLLVVAGQRARRAHS